MLSSVTGQCGLNSAGEAGSTDHERNQAMSNQAHGLQEAGPAELAGLRDREEVALIDVREPAEHFGERIPGAVLYPMSTFDPADFPLDGPRPLLYCRTGNRSARVADRLLDAGWTSITHLRGGIVAWKAQGFETVSDGRAPISLERQVRIAAGALIIAGSALAAFLSVWWLLLPAFVGAGLMCAGITDTCGMAMVLARLPYNRRTPGPRGPASSPTASAS